MSSAQSELEVAKRALKIAEIELSEARSCIYELIISIETVTADRQRLESDIASLNFDLVDAQRGRREAEKRVDRVQLEVNRLRHELRRALHRSCENHHAVGFVSKPLPAKIRERRSGPYTITALQAKLSDIEAELKAVQRENTTSEVENVTATQVNLTQVN